MNIRTGLTIACAIAAAAVLISEVRSQPLSPLDIPTHIVPVDSSTRIYFFPDQGNCQETQRRTVYADTKARTIFAGCRVFFKGMWWVEYADGDFSRIPLDLVKPYTGKEDGV